MAVDKDLVKYGVLAFGAYTFYGLMYNGSFGPQAQVWAAKLRSSWGGTPSRFIAGTGGTTAPSATSPSAAAAPTAPASTGRGTVTDTGRVPLVWSGGAIMQSPSWIATYDPGAHDNVYGTSDVFLDANGNTIGWDQARALLGG